MLKVTFNKDDYMTPESAVNLILPYVKKFKTIWCPFDKEDSNFVKIFKENGINIINTHIDYGNDFLVLCLKTVLMQLCQIHHFQS